MEFLLSNIPPVRFSKRNTISCFEDLLHDAEGGIITIEMKDGSTYRGMLEDAQDNMNLTMKV